MEPATFSSAGISVFRVIRGMLAPRVEGKAGWGTGEMLREGQASSLVNSGLFRKNPRGGC